LIPVGWVRNKQVAQLKNQMKVTKAVLYFAAQCTANHARVHKMKASITTTGTTTPIITIHNFLRITRSIFLEKTTRFSKQAQLWNSTLENCEFQRVKANVKLKSVQHWTSGSSSKRQETNLNQQVGRILRKCRKVLKS